MGRKKNVAIDDDEYSFPQEDDDAPPPPPPEKETRSAPAANKKNKKGAKAQRGAAAPPGRGSSGVSAFSALNALGEDDDEENNEPEPKPAVENNHVGDGGDEGRDLDVDVDLDFGKNKKKKKKKGGRSAQEEEDLDKLVAELGEGPSTAAAVAPPAPQAEEEMGEEKEEEAAAAEEAAASKKSQKKKKKKSGRTAQEEEDLDKILAELGEGPPPPAPPSTSAPAVAAAASAPPPVVEDSALAVTTQEEQGEGEEKDGEGEAESAAAKKKKKKKEKEKEKKAAAAAAAASAASVEVKEEKKEEAKGKGPAGKKPSKAVREMQEALARMKEAEERKKREEEERLRREEEERKRLEELERLKEEAKRRKKEREKEKLLKKKQEGKLLTAKQREEQKRLEAMRKQFLAQSDAPAADGVSVSGGGEVKKRPKYETKKHRPAQAKAVEVEKVAETQQETNEPDNNEEDVEDSLAEDQSQSHSVEGDGTADGHQEEPEEAKPMEEDEDEDEDEWDAKSWDNVDVTLPATSPFDEEEQEETEAKPVAKRSAPPEPQEILKAPAKPAVKKVVAPHDSKTGENELESKSSTNIKKEKEVVAKQDIKATEEKAKKGSSDLRSPICCILGHVDTGKTKLLDCIRQTNVQEGEAGGITQQIGATYFPTENIRERTKELKADATLKVPGLLVIDTPGHESFTNLRSRGSSLCDIAILVVDIMHGLEPQTIESLNLLKSRNTEFIVALNKVDRLYGWKRSPNAPIVKALKQQSEDVKREFNMRLTQIVTQFKEQGLNTALYYKNKEMGETFNIVPTSAISGEGIPDLLLLLIQWAQKTMVEKLTYVDEVQCTVLEVKVIEGLGTTIDVVLVNGILHEGDQIVVCGMQGPIVTNIRALLTPHPMKELRVKGSYQHHKELKAAQGVKISAQGLEHAIAGTALYVVKPSDDLEEIKAAVMHDMNKVMSRIDKSGEGVYVQASTLGSLEALTEFLKSPAVNIPSATLV
uniref:Tr-type G domain-containing protein n=1 Tax=Ananas comosus var. bracteatus TaxID=296719 RepID=A0A6V7P251_ANACO|nr:unnamed protein product [Ananas comosus var. bracteatus]